MDTQGGSESATQADSKSEPIAQAQTQTDSHWNLIKVGDKDYVTVSNIADFYGLPSGSILSRESHTGNRLPARFQMLSQDGREIFINGVRHWLVFPAIPQDGEVLVSRMDLVKSLEPILRPTNIRGLRRFTTVVLDAGHGGHDRGATGRYGAEKDFALATVKFLGPLLQAAGFEVVYTRTRDVFVTLEDRARIANRTPNAIFVSVHFNAGQSSAANGLEVFSLTPRGAPSSIDQTLRPQHMEAQPGNAHDNQSLILATAIHHSMLGYSSQLDRGVKRARFSVLARTRCPAVLVEGGFVTNLAEGRRIANRNWQRNLARSIAEGIISYHRLVDKGLPPKLAAEYRGRGREAEFLASRGHTTSQNGESSESTTRRSEPAPSIDITPGKTN
ncbi:MAG: N-acetylmuramoyl-L-alanine amidase [Verrucomicrobiales bacterium]